jgi:hypothetical protein
MKHWMPINTCEKEHGKKILCYGDGYIFEAECEMDDGFGTWCNIGGAQATHWMPLPEYPNTQPAEQPRETCKWKKTHRSHDSIYDPHGHGPFGMCMKYCPFCGKKIEVVE